MRGVRLSRGVELALVGGLLLVAGLAGFLVIRHGPALDWDESVYAVWARDMVTGTHLEDVPPYRPPGLAFLGTLVAPIGFQDWAVRGLTLALGLLTLASAWLLARTTLSRGAAILGLAGTAATTVVLAQLPKFHNDVPVAGLVMLAMVILWMEFEHRPEPTLRLLVAAPLAAGAFYLRFGVAVALLGIAAIGVVLWWRTMVRHRLLMLGLIASTLALVAPHLIWATQLTGKPWGVIALAATATNQSAPVASAIQFLIWLPTSLAGPVGAVLVIAGVLFGVALVIRRLTGRDALGFGRSVAWLLGMALVTAGATVLISHPEARYMVLPVLLAELVGAQAILLAIAWLADRMGIDTRRRDLASIVGAAGLAAIVLAAIWFTIRPGIRGTPTQTWVRQVGTAIRDHATQPCAVATTITVQIAWYSGCRVVPFQHPQDQFFGLPGDSDWVVLTTLDEGYVGPKLVGTWRAITQPPPIIDLYRNGHPLGAAYMAGH
jgi:hypothetical protein